MKKVILIVDDTPELLRAFERSVKLMGYEVWTAKHGREALDQLHLRRADLVVTDYEMPFVKGDELCREVKKRHGLPVILLSGNVDARKVAVACGAEVFLSKPFENSMLQAGIEGLLR